MVTVYLLNAFSLNMLEDNYNGCIYIDRNLTIIHIKAALKNGFVNAVGHEGTVKLINTLLGLKLDVNRIAVKLQKGDIALVIQIKERLPEGKVLSYNEIEQMCLENKIQFDMVRVV